METQEYEEITFCINLILLIWLNKNDGIARTYKNLREMMKSWIFVLNLKGHRHRYKYENTIQMEVIKIVGDNKKNNKLAQDRVQNMVMNLQIGWKQSIFWPAEQYQMWVLRFSHQWLQGLLSSELWCYAVW